MSLNKNKNITSPFFGGCIKGYIATTHFYSVLKKIHCSNRSFIYNFFKHHPEGLKFYFFIPLTLRCPKHVLYVR